MKGFLEMPEYNFIPDYAAWWKKRDLSKKQMVWLILGVNPNDVIKNQELLNKLDRSDDEQNWLMRFDNFCYQLRPFLGNDYRNYMEILKSEKKEEIVQEAYAAYFDIDNSLYAFLVENGGVIEREELELYKNYTIFEVKKENNGEDLVNENSALAKILNVDGAYFDRFVVLEEICQKSKSERDGFSAYVDFIPEDKWFYSEYGKFIYKTLEMHHTDFMPFILEIKSRRLFRGDFGQYCQSLHDEGFIFQRKTYEHLKNICVYPEYSEKGWAYNFYKGWMNRRPLWTLTEAAKLYLGMAPYGEERFYQLRDNHKKKSGHGLIDYKTVLFFEENGDWNDKAIGDFSKHCSLPEFAKRHISLGNLNVAHQNGDEPEFKPIDIVKFFRDYCPNTYEPKALFQVLGLNKDDGVVIIGTAKTHTGLAGRPTAKHLIMYEFNKRKDRGIIREKISHEADELRAWLVSCHNDVSPPTKRVIENQIRSEYNKSKCTK